MHPLRRLRKALPFRRPGTQKHGRRTETVREVKTRKQNFLPAGEIIRQEFFCKKNEQQNKNLRIYKWGQKYFLNFVNTSPIFAVYISEGQNNWPATTKV